MARKKRLDINEVLDREYSGLRIQVGQDIYHTAGYIRLSIEDSGKSDGYSLINQEKLVRDFIAEQQDMQLYRMYMDNGVTGTVFERPAFDEMMQDMKDGKINCIVVKDLSRLGRNYLEAGNYLEQIFPFFRVRFISITDGYDSISPNVTDESLIIPLKNIINEGYERAANRIWGLYWQSNLDVCYVLGCQSTVSELMYTVETTTGTPVGFSSISINVTSSYTQITVAGDTSGWTFQNGASYRIIGIA